MGDNDQNQYQPTVRHEDANETVAQQDCAENRAACVQDNNRVHTVNNREWTSEEKKRKEWCKSIEKNDRQGRISWKG